MRVKNSSVLSAIEILLGLIILTLVMLDVFDFRLFFAIFGVLSVTFILRGLALLSIGVLRLGTSFSYGFSSLVKKFNIVTSVLTILVAVTILFFEMVAMGLHWLNLLFGIGLLSYGIGRITVGALTNGFNSGFRALIALTGCVVAAFSVIIIVFPDVRFYLYLLFNRVRLRLFC